jgi:hypothetical protein
MKHVKWASAYCMLTGVPMTGMWVIFLLNGIVPELAATPTETMFSIAADNTTALFLVAAGYGLYTGKRWAERALMIFMGALFYSLMIAIGYNAQLREYAFLGMFVTIFSLMAYLSNAAVKG